MNLDKPDGSIHLFPKTKNLIIFSGFALIIYDFVPYAERICTKGIIPINAFYQSCSMRILPLIIMGDPAWSMKKFCDRGQYFYTHHETMNMWMNLLAVVRKYRKFSLSLMEFYKIRIIKIFFEKRSEYLGIIRCNFL